MPDRDAVAEPRALLYTTARNLVTDHHRRAATRQQVEVALHQEESGFDTGLGLASAEPEAVLAGRQRLAAIEQVVAQLPPRAREAFVLYKLDGLSRKLFEIIFKTYPAVAWLARLHKGEPFHPSCL